MHGLFATDLLSVTQCAIGTAYLIKQIVLTLFDEKVAGFTLVVDQHGHNLADLVDQVRLRSPQRDLIADLVKIPHRLGAFSVETSHGEADFLQTSEDLFDLPRDHKCREMEHDAHPHPRADIGRTGGEITKFWVKGVRQRILDQVVNFVDLVPGPSEVQTALHDLNSKMVLFVDHQAKLFLLINQNTTGSIAVCMFATDELAFDKELSIDFLQFGHIDVEGIRPFLLFVERLVDGRFDRGSIDIVAATNERKLSQISSQADAAADDDVRFRTGPAQPFTTLRGKFIEVHDWACPSGPLPSTVRIWSRRLDAVS